MGLKMWLFTAGWRQPCRRVKPVVQELVKEYGLGYDFQARHDVSGSSFRVNLGTAYTYLLNDRDRIVVFNVL